MYILFISYLFNNPLFFHKKKGGIKAVVWTDVVQGAIMIGSVALFCFLGAQKVGGFSEVINRAAMGGRLNVE